MREERLRQNIGVRELARRVGVSASLISQVELGRASPSVGTLYAIVNVLGLLSDSLLLDAGNVRRCRRHARPPRRRTGRTPGRRTGDPACARGSRGASDSAEPQDVDFVAVVYEVGGESCPADSLMRHSGTEYGYVLAGHLKITGRL